MPPGIEEEGFLLSGMCDMVVAVVGVGVVGGGLIIMMVFGGAWASGVTIRSRLL